MDVRVAGHQVDTGESLRDHATRRIEEITEKYFSRAVAANVTFGRGPNNDFTCDIVAPVAQGVVLKASHRAHEAQMAFNGAADRIEKQLRRYVKRLREHKANGEPFIENAGYTVFSAPSDDDEAPAHPTIIAETRADIPVASVSDAVMLMDLRNTNALMFKNSASGDLNMIYRREDGNIGWVEPQGS
ncbi:ribosome-associated translation inhibitor RaiA [Sphingomonas sp.]|uniref:ribosome hibernation-promoting factor, HPF/YfiA family n=1 Tax=Sphingomonas sp. TaxID=28214 RepID=UPI0018375299|nr:ribosome-associated translation inhibitor RaiA [Sphingomonas sp.]MBA3510441.1 ribosome-associated translation inhibitor RaiA [Sphingomonas sp.]